MKERGILMTPENYTKTDDGIKVQTRRIIKPQPLHGLGYMMSHDKTHAIQNGPDYPDGPEDCIACPYGTVGDRLYVKEGLEKNPVSGLVRYRRDKKNVGNFPDSGPFVWTWQKYYLSPLHMPKWAARLWLELTGVRVERLHEISEADARAEGCRIKTGRQQQAAVEAFRELWESNEIHKPGSWDLNPWVWVLEYRKVA